jgi:hypothetical protein
VKWPDAVAFDPVQHTASTAVESFRQTTDATMPVLLLAVGSQAQRSGWAGRTAIAIAEALAARGERVVLADLSLNLPELHDRLGTDNEEGLSDVFLFGASLSHIMRSVVGKPFRFIPASMFTPDAREVLTHERWGGLFEELTKTQSKLLVYLPVRVVGAREFSRRVGSTVVLADSSELAMVKGVLDDDVDVCGVLVPRAAGTIAQPWVSNAEFEKIRIPKDTAREALIADLRARQRAALMAPPPAMAPLSEAEAPLPRVARPTPKRPGQPVIGGAVFTLPAMHPTGKTEKPWLLWLLVALVLAGAGAAGWYLYRSRQQPAPGPAAAAPPATRPTVAAPVAPLDSARVALPYSVAIAGYQVLDLAQEQMRALRQREPGTAFYIGPIAVQGRLFYRVMAGMLADSASAVALRDTLVTKRIKTVRLAGDVVQAPYAFLLGEYPTIAEADAMQQTARIRLVPSYIVEAANPDGSTQYKLYAGAYTGPGDAEFMRPILRGAGLPDNLVERTGSIRS